MAGVGIWGNIDDEEPQGGLLAGIQRGVMNPMTLGGLGLLSGEGFSGMTQGMRVGAGFQDQQRQLAEQQRQKKMFEGLLGTVNVPQDYKTIARMQGPQGGAETLAKFMDPNRDLERRYKEAQIGKLNKEANDAGASFGKTGNIFQDPTTGQFYSVQFGSNGQKLVEPIGGGLTPSRGVGEVDTGTGTEIIDKATGKAVRTVGKDVFGAASQKTQGEAQGTARASLPTVEATASRALDTIQKIRTHPGKQYGVGVPGVLPGIPGTQQKGFVTLVDQAKGQTFLEAFNSLRGGGAITEAEGRKATEAFARLDRAQTPQDFDAALSDLEAVIKEGVRVARMKAGGDALSGRGAQPFTQGAPLDLGDGFTVEMQ